MSQTPDAKYSDFDLFFFFFNPYGMTSVCIHLGEHSMEFLVLFFSQKTCSDMSCKFFPSWIICQILIFLEKISVYISLREC